jgi:hypothetical protein
VSLVALTTLVVLTSAGLLLVSSKAPTANAITSWVLGIWAANFLTILYVLGLPLALALLSQLVQVPLVLACVVAGSQVHNCGIVARPPGFRHSDTVAVTSPADLGQSRAGLDNRIAEAPAKVLQAGKPVNLIVKDVRLVLGLLSTACDAIKQAGTKVVNVMLSHRK